MTQGLVRDYREAGTGTSGNALIGDLGI